MIVISCSQQRHRRPSYHQKVKIKNIFSNAIFPSQVHANHVYNQCTFLIAHQSAKTWANKISSLPVTSACPCFPINLFTSRISQIAEDKESIDRRRAFHRHTCASRRDGTVRQPHALYATVKHLKFELYFNRNLVVVPCEIFWLQSASDSELKNELKIHRFLLAYSW